MSIFGLVAAAPGLGTPYIMMQSIFYNASNIIEKIFFSQKHSLLVYFGLLSAVPMTGAPLFHSSKHPSMRATQAKKIFFSRKHDYFKTCIFFLQGLGSFYVVLKPSIQECKLQKSCFINGTLFSYNYILDATAPRDEGTHISWCKALFNASNVI